MSEATATIYQFPVRNFNEHNETHPTVMGAPRSIAPLRLVVDYIPKFVADMTTKGRAERTIKTYIHELKDFSAYVPSIDAPFSDFEIWVDHLVETGYAPSTIHLKHTIINSFFNWLYKQRIIAVNPIKAERISNMPRQPMTDVTSSGFTAQEISRLRQAVDDIERFGSKGRSKSARLETRLVFMLALTTGMRVGELASIRLSEFEVRDDVWWLNIPKAKWHDHGRYVRMERETVFVLLDYVDATKDDREKLVDVEDGIDDYLFVASRRNTARKRICERLGEVMDVADTRFDGKGRRRQLFHAFRKTVISHAANHGATPGEVESAFGVGANTARRVYINPTLNQRHDKAIAAADALVASSKRAVESFETSTYHPFRRRSDSRVFGES